MSAKLLWLDKEVEYLAGNYLTSKHKDISLVVNKTTRQIRNKLHKMGLTTPQNVINNRTRIARLDYSENIQKKKSQKNPFRGYSIYSITYFALIRKRKRRRGGPNLKNILKDICEAFNYSIEDILGHAQNHEYVLIRQIFCYVCKKVYPKVPHTDIANFLGYTSHAMSIRGVQMVENKIKVNDPSFMDEWYKYLKETKIFKQ